MKQNKLSKLESTQQLIQAIRGRAELRLFFKNLWRDKKLQALFFAHREILFPYIKDGRLEFALPFLFFDTLPDDDDEREQVEQLVHTPLQLKAEKQDALHTKLKPGTERIVEEIKALGCLLTVRFIRENAPLKELVAYEGAPTYGDVKRALSNSPPTMDATLDDFSDIGNLWNESPTVGGDPSLLGLFREAVEYVRRAMKTGSIELEDQAIGLFDFATDSLDTPSKLLPLYLAGKFHVDSLLATQELSRVDYRKILTELYMPRVVDNFFTAFICGQCHDDPVVLTTTSRLSPTKQNVSCPKCQQRMFVVGLYRVDSLLLQSAFHKDGLLSIAIGWLLAEKGLGCKSGTYFADRETDWVIEASGRTILVECKMHKTGKDDETVSMNLSKSVEQASKTANEIISSGKRLDDVVVVTNYDLERYSTERAAACAGRNASKLTCRLHLMDPPRFEQFVRQIG